MGKLVAYLIVLIMISLSFLPMSAFYDSKIQTREIEQALNLSCKVLLTSFSEKFQLMKNLGEGAYIYDIIDRNILVDNFFDILSNNYIKDERFEETVDKIKMLLLVSGDRLYYAGVDRRWSIPIFFAEFNHNLNTEVYYNILNDSIYYYRDGTKIYTDISNLMIDRKSKTQYIIDRINTIIMQHTANRIMTGTELVEFGLRLNIKNPYLTDYNEIFQNMHFNVLEGISFIVIYSTGRNLEAGGTEYIFKNLAASGYTLKRIGNNE